MRCSMGFVSSPRPRVQYVAVTHHRVAFDRKRKKKRTQMYTCTCAKQSDPAQDICVVAGHQAPVHSGYSIQSSYPNSQTPTPCTLRFTPYTRTLSPERQTPCAFNSCNACPAEFKAWGGADHATTHVRGMDGKGGGGHTSRRPPRTQDQTPWGESSWWSPRGAPRTGPTTRRRCGRW